MNSCGSMLTMVEFVCFPHTMAALCLRHVPLFYAPMMMRKCVINAKLETEKDDLLLNNAAMQRASLRLKETLSADPLFVDPYIECLSPPEILADVVLMTDGMDARPYRLNWPASTILFDVSPERIFKQTIKKLEDVGAKIPRRCLLHVPSETSDIQQRLQSKGFNGSRPSIWVFQGFPILNLTDFKDILDVVSNLATKGSLLLGKCLFGWVILKMEPRSMSPQQNGWISSSHDMVCGWSSWIMRKLPIVLGKIRQGIDTLMCYLLQSSCNFLMIRCHFGGQSSKE